MKDNTTNFKERRKQKEAEKPVCRVCASKDEHTTDYNTPTMACILFLRTEINDLRGQLKEAQNLNPTSLFGTIFGDKK